MATNPEPAVNQTRREDTSAPKFFLASKTVWIALIGFLLVPALKKFGVEFTDADTQAAADLLGKFAALLGVVWARSKAGGPLHFGNGAAALLLGFALVSGLLGGCAPVDALRPRLVSLANSEGKMLVRIVDSAADAQVQRLNDAIERAVKAAK